MDRGELRRLSKDQLSELVRRLQRPDNTSRTSSKPPSTDKKEKRENARTGGAKLGHEPHNLQLSLIVSAVGKVRTWRVRRVRPSTAMRRKPPVHRTNLEGVLRVELTHSVSRRRTTGILRMWLIPLSQVTRSRFSGLLRPAAAIADGQRQDQRWSGLSASSSILSATLSSRVEIHPTATTAWVCGTPGLR